MKNNLRIPAPLIFIFMLAFCWSCNSKEEKKEPDAEKTIAPDSVAIKQEVTNPYAPVDISPMDMSYYPADYPKLKMAKQVTAPPIARVVYSRPHLQGRQLFRDLLKYGEPWRLGANESTELQLYRDVTIQSKKVKAGRYVLYCIPQQNNWSIILNSNIDSWGLQPDSTKDIAHFDIPVQQNNHRLEYFTMVFEKIDNGAELVMAWDDVEARLPINF